MTQVLKRIHKTAGKFSLSPQLTLKINTRTISGSAEVPDIITGAVAAVSE